jgi:hypothetical protein
MSDEQIKEITVAAIEKGMLYTGIDNIETAQEIANFINTLREKLKDVESCDSELIL